MNFKKIATLSIFIFPELLMISCSEQTTGAWARTERTAEVESISSYDVIMRSIADSSHFDWQLLSAIAFHESRFQHDARSNRGAVGLMQIMPRTARQLGYDTDKLYDPQVSVEIALKLLHTIEGTFRFPASMPQSDKFKVILAAYNAGPGFMIRVRKEAAQEGAAYNSFATLSQYITREGTHKETVQFANNVYKKYQQYLSI
ncbi:MAG: transglycosylase SLT domain-containing protein [Mucinivorans sp.]